MKTRLFISILTLFLSSNTTFSQYCLSGGPSQTADSNVESVNISGDAGSSISHTGCPGVTGLEDLTSQVVIVSAGANYSMTVQFGTCGGNYGGSGEAWIDFNQNMIFEASESIGTWSGTPPVSASVFNFNVPSFSQTGTTRMRIVQQESGSIPLDPCAAFTWGSAMDFSVIVQNGFNCSGYPGNTPSDAIEVISLPYSDTKSTSVCYFSVSPVYSSPDVFYVHKVNPNATHIRASLCGSNFDTHISIQDTGFTALYYNDDDDACAPQSEVYFPTAGLDSIYIVVEGYGNDTGTYVLNVEELFNTTDAMDEQLLKPSFYPNPSSGRISIKNLNHGEVSIYSMEGSKLLTVDRNFNHIDISDLLEGVYLIEIIDANGIQRDKLIIE